MKDFRLSCLRQHFYDDPRSRFKGTLNQKTSVVLWYLQLLFLQSLRLWRPLKNSRSFMISGTSVTVPAHADNYKTERALSIWLLNILNLIKENSN